MFTGMTPPSISILTGHSALSSPYKRSQISIPDDFTPTQPLISATSLDQEEVATSTLPERSFTSSFKSSYSEFPQQQKCSFSQSVLNGTIFFLLLENILFFCTFDLLGSLVDIHLLKFLNASVLISSDIVCCDKIVLHLSMQPLMCYVALEYFQLLMLSKKGDGGAFHSL